jgi:hypothetical protein
MEPSNVFPFEFPLELFQPSFQREIPSFWRSRHINSKKPVYLPARLCYLFHKPVVNIERKSFLN